MGPRVKKSKGKAPAVNNKVQEALLSNLPTTETQPPQNNQPSSSQDKNSISTHSVEDAAFVNHVMNRLNLPGDSSKIAWSVVTDSDGGKSFKIDTNTSLGVFAFNRPPGATGNEICPSAFLDISGTSQPGSSSKVKALDLFSAVKPEENDNTSNPMMDRFDTLPVFLSHQQNSSIAPLSFKSRSPSPETLGPPPSSPINPPTFSFDVPSPASSQTFWLGEPKQGDNPSTDPQQNPGQSLLNGTSSASAATSTDAVGGGQTLPPVTPLVSVEDLADFSPSTDMPGSFPDSVTCDSLDLKGLGEADYVEPHRLFSNLDASPTTATPSAPADIVSTSKGGLIGGTSRVSDVRQVVKSKVADRAKHNENTANNASNATMPALAMQSKPPHPPNDTVLDSENSEEWKRAKNNWIRLHSKGIDFVGDPLKSLVSTAEFVQAYNDHGWRDGPKPPRDGEKNIKVGDIEVSKSQAEMRHRTASHSSCRPTSEHLSHQEEDLNDERLASLPKDQAIYRLLIQKVSLEAKVKQLEATLASQSEYQEIKQKYEYQCYLIAGLALFNVYLMWLIASTA